MIKNLGIGTDEEDNGITEMFFQKLTLFLGDYVKERLWLPIQSPNNGKKKKAKGR